MKANMSVKVKLHTPKEELADIGYQGERLLLSRRTDTSELCRGNIFIPAVRCLRRWLPDDSVSCCSRQCMLPFQHFDCYASSQREMGVVIAMTAACHAGTEEILKSTLPTLG